MPRPALTLALVFLCTAAAGCERPDPQREAARRSARTAACIADELSIAAGTRVRELEGMLREMESTGSPMAPAMRSSLVFARAYAREAELGRSGLAHVDSALNAATPADSARHAEAARGTSAMPPAAGTVEANAADEWAESFQQALRNPDHPCHPAER